MEVAWTSDHGLPHSALLRWDPQDRAKLMAHLLEKAQRCTMCGTAEWEWDPEQGGDRNAYEPTTHNCMGCYHIKNAHADAELMPGASITLTPSSQVHKLNRARS